MSLPKLERPVHIIKLPVQKQKLEIRPYILKEEKAFLTTINSENDDDIINSYKSLVSTCVITEDFNIDDLNIVDFFYLLIRIKMKSNGEMVEGNYTCTKCEKNSQCEINLETAIKAKNTEVVTELVKISDILSLELTNPKIDYIFLMENTDDVDSILNIIGASVSKVIYDNKVYTKLDIKELRENILENLTQIEFDKINKGINKLAKLVIEFEFICTNCSHVNKIESENILSFF